MFSLRVNIEPVFLSSPASLQFQYSFGKGYFLVHHATLSTRTDFPAQLWKEYSLSDSRYLSGDKFVLAIESITIVRDLFVA
jgi:hypothetical protein